MTHGDIAMTNAATPKPATQACWAEVEYRTASGFLGTFIWSGEAAGPSAAQEIAKSACKRQRKAVRFDRTVSGIKSAPALAGAGL